MADETPERTAAEPANGQPLPPIPDGGLARSMPDWLREPPPARSPRPANDPAAFLTADDLPPWLRQLAIGTPPEPPPQIRAGDPTLQVRPGSGPAPATGAPTVPTPPINDLSPAKPVPIEPHPVLRQPEPATLPVDRSLRLAIAGLVVLALIVIAILYARGVL